MKTLEITPSVEDYLKKHELELKDEFNELLINAGQLAKLLIKDPETIAVGKILHTAVTNIQQVNKSWKSDFALIYPIAKAMNDLKK